MSLLTRINKLFSKQQADQIIGIALQQESLSACTMQALTSPPSESNAALASPSFQHIEVNNADFAKAALSLQNDGVLAGQCHLVLNAQQSQIVQVDKPNIPAGEMVAALKWQIKDLVTISPDNMVLDYFDGPLLSGGIEKIQVVCAPLNELKKLVGALNQTGVEVVSIVTEEFAFANLLPFQKEACLLVCQQPNEEIVLLIVKQGQLYFQRRLRGFSKMALKAEHELTMMIDSLALEIQRSSDYFERQLKQAPIKEIKVLLPMSTEGFFARKLAENTHIPVTLLTMPDSCQQHRDYAATIGATLFDSRQAERTAAAQSSESTYAS